MLLLSWQLLLEFISFNLGPFASSQRIPVTFDGRGSVLPKTFSMRHVTIQVSCRIMRRVSCTDVSRIWALFIMMMPVCGGFDRYGSA